MKSDLRSAFVKVIASTGTMAIAIQCLFFVLAFAKPASAQVTAKQAAQAQHTALQAAINTATAKRDYIDSPTGPGQTIPALISDAEGLIQSFYYYLDGFQAYLESYLLNEAGGDDQDPGYQALVVVYQNALADYATYVSDYEDIDVDWDDVHCTLEVAIENRSEAVSYDSTGSGQFSLGIYWEMQPPEHSGDYYYLLAYYSFQSGCSSANTSFNEFCQFIDDAEGGLVVQHADSIEGRLETFCASVLSTISQLP